MTLFQNIQNVQGQLNALALQQHTLLHNTDDSVKQLQHAVRMNAYNTAWAMISEAVTNAQEQA
jgi:hypothetical protein